MSIKSNYNNYKPPKHAGDRVLYTSPNVNIGKRLVFVNGIMNTPEDHRNACVDLMDATSCEVLGVYNQTGFDKPEQLTSIYEAVNVKGKSLNDLSNLIDDVLECASDQVGLVARALGYTGNSPNKCTNSLLNLLLFNAANWPNKPLCIVAHSQGNLITSNALMLYSALISGKKTTKNDYIKKMLAKGSPACIYVFSVASPAISWPTNHFIDVGNYWHRWDPVTAFSIGRNMQGSDSGQGAVTDRSSSHSFSSYLENKLLVDAICKKIGT
ncbi:MAG: hypothetical protein QX198_17175 [Methylococcaceae bacterium]